jgi:hypothetical protein
MEKTFVLWEPENWQHCKWWNPQRGTQTSPRRYLFSKCLTVSRYYFKRNFIYAHKKGMAFPEPIRTKLINVQWHYVEISHTELHQNRPINVESMDKNYFSSSREVSSSLADFRENYCNSINVCKHLPCRFYLNLMKNVGNTDKVSFTRLSTVPFHPLHKFPTNSNMLKSII